MERRTLLVGSLLALGALSVGYALFAPVSDEERVQHTLDRLAALISFSEPIGNPAFFASHLNEEFEDLLTDPVHVELADVGAQVPSARGQLGLAAAMVLSRFGALAVSFSYDSITVQGDTATAEVSATVNVDEGGVPRHESRTVTFQLARDGSVFRVASARIAGPDEE